MVKNSKIKVLCENVLIEEIYRPILKGCVCYNGVMFEVEDSCINIPKQEIKTQSIQPKIGNINPALILPILLGMNTK